MQKSYLQALRGVEGYINPLGFKFGCFDQGIEQAPSPFRGVGVYDRNVFKPLRHPRRRGGSIPALEGGLNLNHKPTCRGRTAYETISPLRGPTIKVDDVNNLRFVDSLT